MKMQDYHAGAVSTASLQFHSQNVPPEHLASVLIMAIHLGKEIDLLKKALFYGKDISGEEQHVTPLPMENAGWARFDAQPDLQKLLHGVMGVIGEGSELAQALIDQFDKTGDVAPLDKPNVIEETGDTLWYLPLICEAMGITLEDAAEINRLKLAKRYGDSFSSEKALNRDLEGERVILESGR